MIRELLSKFNIDSFAFVPASLLKSANGRLFSSVPEGCNVIFMLFPYYSGDCGGKISAYGSVYDYHSFAEEVFASLEDLILKKYPRSYAKGFADHSPYLECEGAAIAGLGILGENSLLITKKYSSYVFIGELVTSVSEEELTAQGVPKGTGVLLRCEGCSACRRACPSGCIGGTRDKCISQITQKKGELSKEEQCILINGGSIWGCDICQSVCPHTKNVIRNGTVKTPISFFSDSYLGADPCRAIEEMDDITFSRYPFSWRKRQTVQRNINIIKGK